MDRTHESKIIGNLHHQYADLREMTSVGRERLEVQARTSAIRNVHREVSSLVSASSD